MHSPVYLKSQCQIVLCVDANQDFLECEVAFLIISSPPPRGAQRIKRETPT
jgi:hypothetical protein